MVFVDRKAKYPGRWTIIKSDGTSEVVTLVRNDEPEVEGTPMNAETLNTLSDVAGADVARLQAEAARDAAAGSATKASGSASAAEESKTAAATSEANAAKHEEAAKKAAIEAGAKAGTDKTLSIENAPADAKATGEELAKKANKDLIVDKYGNVLYYSKAAVDEMLIGYRKRLGPIPNDDFNDATKEGVYTYVNSVKNGYADQAAGTLEVYNNGNNGVPGTYGVWIYQVAYPVNGYAPFFRTRTDANGWTPWQELTRIAELQAASVIASGAGYVRFGDGTQICWGETDQIVVSANSTVTATIAYPAAFASGYPVEVSLTIAGNSENDSYSRLVSHTTNRTTTNCVIYFKNTSSKSMSPIAQWIVIGRWK